MLISGGQVLAIDKVITDDTLSGDGVYRKLGVVGFIKESDADNRYQPKGDYYTQEQINVLFASKDYLSSNYYDKNTVYTKDEVDFSFQPKGDYVTQNTFNSAIENVRDHITENYYNKLAIDTLLNAKANTDYVDAEINDLSGKFSNELTSTATELNSKISAVQTSLDTHIDNSAAHLVFGERSKLDDIFKINFNSFITLPNLPNDTPYNFVMTNGSASWEPETIIKAGTGLSSTTNENVYKICLPQTAIDILAKVDDSADEWDTVSDKSTVLYSNTTAVANKSYVYFLIEDVEE